MRKKTSKAIYVGEMADHIVETLRPHERPVVIMWSNVMNSFDAMKTKDGEHRRIWRKDEKAVHEHWKQFGQDVVRVLRRQYELTIVAVGKSIRNLADHGQLPDRSEDEDKPLARRRTDANYRRCLAGTCNPAMGFVAFPRNTQQDHPLTEASLRRNVQAGTSHVVNAIDQVETARDFGTLSSESRDAIRGIAVETSRRIIEGPLPLFPRSLEGPMETEETLLGIGMDS